MSYENAASTKLVATRCCCCGRPLVDAASLARGVGPDCADRYGFFVEVPEEIRKEANALIYKLAANPKTEFVPAICARLAALGFATLSAKLIGKLAKVVVTEKAGMFAVKTPYNADVVEAMRRIPGRRWVSEEKLNYFPVSQKAALFSLLKAHFNGETAVGPKGVFVICAVAAPLATEPQPVMPVTEATFEEMEDAERAMVEDEMAQERAVEEACINDLGEFDCSKVEDALTHYRRTGLPTFTDLTNHAAIERKAAKYRR